MTGNKIKVCMLVDNPGSNDVRVIKEAATLVDAGYEVVLIGENRKRENFPAEEFVRGVHVKRYCLPTPRESFPQEKMDSQEQEEEGQQEVVAPEVASQEINSITPIREIPNLMGEGYQSSEGALQKIEFTWHLFRIFVYKVGLYIKWKARVFYLFLRRNFVIIRRQSFRFLRTIVRGLRRTFSRYSRGYLRTIYRAVIKLDKHTHRYLTLIDMVKNEDADIYHAHDYPSFMIVVDAVGDTDKKIIYDSHELYFDRQPSDTPHKNLRRSYRLERKQEADAVKRASFVITVSDSIADIMAEKWNIPKPVVLRNVVDNSVPGEREIEFGQEGKRILVHSGNITYGRNINNIVASLPYLPEDIVLVLMGKPNPPILEGVMAQAEELGCSDKIVAVPPVKLVNVSETLAQADAGIVLFSQDALNYRFGLPNKLFEYVMAGIPVVVGQATEIRNVVQRYNMGVSCDEQDPRSIASAIESVLDKKKNNLLRKNVLAASQELNWKQEEKILLKAYQGIFS